MAEPGTRRPPFSMIRSLVLADFVTLANAACGTSSIFCCLNYMTEHDNRWLWGAFLTLPFALAFDMADGTIARWRHRQSPYGADLDSLADVISFGVAPAVLGFAIGLRGVWDSMVLIFFVAAGIARLARYNVTAEELTTEKGKVAYYEGTPIPTSLGIVLVLFALHHLGASGARLLGGDVRVLGATFHPLVLLYLLSGSFMVSTIRIPKP
jgi:CDP-diacylglycerol---serine O-phosphatidyltransferase